MGGISNPSGSIKLIQRQVIGVATNLVTFDNIPQSFEDLIISLTCRMSVAGGSEYCYVRLNNDSAALYDWREWGNGGTGGAIGQTQGIIGGCVADASPAGNSTTYETQIAAYARSVFNKNIVSVGVANLSALAAGLNFLNNEVTYHNTAAINRVDLFPQTSNFMVGSVFSLFGRV